MKKIMTIGIVAALCSASAACTQTEQRTAGYGASGAALGALAGGALTGTGRGALAGAAIGATGATLASSAANNNRAYVAHTDRYRTHYVERRGVHHRYCDYKDKNGEWFKAPC